MSAQVENTIPVLPVNDMRASIRFYSDALGFDLEWNAGAVCSVARDGHSMMLQLSNGVSPTTVWIGLVDDSLFKRLQTRARVLQSPTNQPWAYEMKVADPDGNILWLGTRPQRGDRGALGGKRHGAKADEE